MTMWGKDMTQLTLGAAAAALFATAGATFAADVTTLDCIDFNVTLEPQDVSAIQERYGDQAEFEKVVCVTAAQLPIDEYTEPTRVDVVVKPIDYHLMVVVEKLEHNK